MGLDTGIERDREVEREKKRQGRKRKRYIEGEKEKILYHICFSSNF